MILKESIFDYARHHSSDSGVGANVVFRSSIRHCIIELRISKANGLGPEPHIKRRPIARKQSNAWLSGYLILSIALIERVPTFAVSDEVVQMAY